MSASTHADTTTLTVADASKGTNNKPVTMSFPVTRTGDLGYDAVLNYHTIDGTAVAGTDYTAATGSLFIPAGTAAASIPVLLNAQTGSGADVTFQLQLDGAAGVGPSPSFTAQQTFATGSGPQSVAFADIDGDGKLDMVVTNGNSGTVSVLLNTTAPGATAPTFAALQTFTTGGNPTSVKVADINGDGKPDLVVANDGSNSVSVLLNTTPTGNTTLTFFAQPALPVGLGPWTVAVADVNGDGKPDMIVTNVEDNSVSLFINNTTTGAAAATFAARQNFATGNSPIAVAVADINGDGKPDLIVDNDLDGTFSVLLNTGSGFASQQTFTAGSFPFWSATADVNGDGKPDVITTSSDNTVAVMINTTTPGSTTPTFSALQFFATGANPQFVGAVDVNGDGKPDLVVANFNDSTVSLLRNTTVPGAATAAFAAQQTFATGSGTFFVAAGDINGDGKPDLAVVNHNGSTLSVLLNTTASSTSVNFAAQQSFATDFGPESIVAIDLNGDGIVDVASANSEANTISVLRGTTAPGSATATFAAQQTFDVGGDPFAIVAGDFSRSGRLDLAVVNNASNTVSVLDNRTGPTDVNFASALTFAVGPGPNAIVAFDVNGDGLPDLVVSNFADNTISVLLNMSTSPGTSNFATQQTFAATTLPNALAVGDVNRDGKPDLLVTSFTGNVVAVMLNTTVAGSMTAAFSSPQPFATGTDPNSVVVGDFNGDGNLDIATANNISNNISVLFGTTTIGSATCTFAPAVNFPVGLEPEAISAADIDGDGRLDLLVANYATNTVSLLRNTTSVGASTPTFDAQRTFAVGSNPAAITTADIDGDGRPDIVIANQQGASISVLSNSQYRATIATPAATGTIVHDYIFDNGFE